MSGERIKYGVETIKGIEVLTADKLNEIAVLYAEVFAPPPWNEAVKCSACGCFAGQETELGSVCVCGGKFEEAYPIGETCDYIMEEAKHTGFRLAMAQNNGGGTLGFAWSYLIAPESLVEEKWKTPKTRERVLEAIRKETGDAKLIRYLSECGVREEVRGNGVASLLTRTTIGPECSVIRTNCRSPITAIGQREGFQQILGPRMIIDRQRKVFIETGELVNGISDEENPDRVILFRNF